VRLLGAAHVRNEADIVEAFVRHNLVLLDGLAIVDHASVDATPDILRALKDEGLPVFLARDESPAFDQRPMQNRLVRHLLATSDATWIFPLDADEFLRAPSRDALVNALSSVGNIPDLALEWTTYVPDFDAHDDVLACVRNARRVRDDGHGLRKVAVSRAFGADADLYLSKGQHRVLSRRSTATRPASHVADRRTLSIAHVPIRSAGQFTAKVALGWLANLRVPAREPNESLHWKEAFDSLRSGRPLTRRQLESFAFNYGVPMERWLPTDAHQLVDDPFLHDFALRYPRGAALEPLTVLLRQLEQLLRPIAPN